MKADRRASRAWWIFFRALYRLLRWLDPLIRLAWRSGGLGITAELIVAGRRTGRQRSLLVGLLNVDRHWYVGHPNGSVYWTRDLAAAGEARVAQRPGLSASYRAVRLGPGLERDAVIHATARQQPFPGNLFYRFARRHILAVGEYFRLEP